jgi:tetratricopeptide (TPR) repeat protein
MSSVPTPVAASRGRRRRTALWLLAAGATLAAAAAAAVYLWRRPSPPPVIEVAGLDPEAAAAIEAARADVVAHPRSGAAWGRLGMVLFANDLQAESLACLGQAEDLEPREVRWPYYRGLILLHREPEAALAPLRRATALAGREIAPRLRLAEALLAQDRLDEAKAEFGAVLREQADNPRALLGLGQIAYRQGKLQESVPDLRRAADSPLAEKAAHATLAEVCQRLGDGVATESERGRVADLPADPPWPDPLLREVEQLRTGLAARLDQADALAGQGQVAEAAGLLRGALHDHPESDRAHLDLGRALIRLNDVDGAEDELRAALRLNPESINAHFLLGGVRVLKKDDAEAESCFRTVIRLKPTHALAHYNLGLCRLRRKDPAGAAEAFRTALRCRPNMTDAHVALAEVLLEQGQTAEARGHLEDALRLAPDHEKARQLLAKAKGESRP